jgi:hypothetical protein
MQRINLAAYIFALCDKNLKNKIWTNLIFKPEREPKRPPTREALLTLLAKLAFCQTTQTSLTLVWRTRVARSTLKNLVKFCKLRTQSDGG